VIRSGNQLVLRGVIWSVQAAVVVAVLTWILVRGCA
jgi:hypothetical protein